MLAKILLAKPDLLLLDEPTVGLDANAAQDIMALLLDFHQHGTTVLGTDNVMMAAVLARGTTVIAGAACAVDAPQSPELSAKWSGRTVLDLKVKDIDGKEVSLADWKGKVLVIVNVASRCGFTRQYTGLQALQEAYGSQGFTVLAFPCNDFGGQEPGTETEIRKFCTTRFNVTFPLFAKVSVQGAGAHPLFAALTGKDPGLTFYKGGSRKGYRSLWADLKKAREVKG